MAGHPGLPMSCHHEWRPFEQFCFLAASFSPDVLRNRSKAFIERAGHLNEVKVYRCPGPWPHFCGYLFNTP
jgi:hypothetical protein